MSRRQFLWESGGGLGGIALAGLLGDGRLLAADGGGKLGGVYHHPPTARRVVQLFMAGAASHVDLYDYKPRLIADDGNPWDPGEKVELFQNGLGATMASPCWLFCQT